MEGEKSTYKEKQPYCQAAEIMSRSTIHMPAKHTLDFQSNNKRINSKGFATWHCFLFPHIQNARGNFAGDNKIDRLYSPLAGRELLSGQKFFPTRGLMGEPGTMWPLLRGGARRL